MLLRVVCFLLCIISSSCVHRPKDDKNKDEATAKIDPINADDFLSFLGVNCGDKVDKFEAILGKPDEVSKSDYDSTSTWKYELTTPTKYIKNDFQVYSKNSLITGFGVSENQLPFFADKKLNDKRMKILSMNTQQFIESTNKQFSELHRDERRIEFYYSKKGSNGSTDMLSVAVWCPIGSGNCDRVYINWFNPDLTCRS